jgi:uncharacterized protein YjbI with pentapeptide repeats
MIQDKGKKCFSDQTLVGENFAANELENVIFEGCKLENCNFSESKLRSSIVEDCVFEGCDLSNASFSGSRFHEVRLKRCKVIGVNWTQLEALRGVEFESCNLSFGNFMSLKLKRLKMTHCRAQESDFRQADLSEADLRGTDLSGALFNQTILLKADLRDALNYVIDPTMNRIKDAKFSLPEAIGLLTGLGIKLE